MKHAALLFAAAALVAVNFTAARAQDPAARIPLTELGAGMYRSFPGGLYPGGKNERPSGHDSAGVALARSVTPLRTDGTPDARTGAIVLLSIGMSNTTQEFSTFKPMADTDRTKNPQLKIIDGAQGGQTASIIANPAAAFWTVVDQRIAASGASAKQVQAAWIKEADANPTKAFPLHAQTLSAELEAIARILTAKFPNLRLAFLSSRIYGGYATSSLNPEPYAYESGFSVKWLIEKQINGDTSLAYAGPKVRAPWLAWGPYLWADGMNARSDGLRWDSTDVIPSDRTHPSTSGREKVAAMLLQFFKTDPAATPWFLKQPTSVARAGAPSPDEFTLSANYPNPFNPATTISFSIPRRSHVSISISTILGTEIATLVDQDLPAGEHSCRWNASGMPSGMYLYRLRSGSFTKTNRMLLLQ